MVVLSLFDGMSCGQIALNQLGYNINEYYASEIDPYAIQITKKNYPNTIHIGDVSKVSYKNGILYTEDNQYNIPHIDLLIGGSPCVGFSKAGKKLNFNDPHSKLFFEYARIKDEVNPDFFLLENVLMKQEHIDVITSYMGVEHININSSLLSAQNRVRLYWTNIPGVKLPEDKGIVLSDILDVNERTTKKNIERLSKSYFSELGLKEFHTDSVSFTTITRFRAGKEGEKKWVKKHDETIVQRGHKHATLTTSHSSLVKLNDSDYDPNKPFEKCVIRKVTVNEAEKLQTVPIDYTEGVSKTQRYKMLGNGWTVETIKHIFKNI